MAFDPEILAAEGRLGATLGGKYVLESLLGMGGMAAVYAARLPDGSRVALKVLHDEMSRRPDIRQRFAQEAGAASRIVHPGVVKIQGSGEEPDGTAYIIMELLEGEPLSAVIKRAGTLALLRLVDVLDQVLDVLAAAHAQGIVHRDLKPDNLFVTAGGRIKVLDFGIARVLDDVPGAYKTKTNVTLGTTPFMSPEQALGKRDKVDGRSDLFSLGAMTFRIVAGRNVHQGESDAEILVAMATKPAPPLSSVAPKTDPGLCSIVDVALAFSKDSRYPDAKTMQEDVRALAEGRTPPYANRVHVSRGMSTRVDMVAPVIPNAAVPTNARMTVPEATANTQPNGPSSFGPETHAPSGQRNPFTPAPGLSDPRQAARTVENPIFSLPTAPMPAMRDLRDPTLASPPSSGQRIGNQRVNIRSDRPPGPGKRRRAGLVAAGAFSLVALGAAGAYLVMAPGVLAPAPQASAAAEPTTPMETATPPTALATAAAASPPATAAAAAAPGAVAPAPSPTPASPSPLPVVGRAPAPVSAPLAPPAAPRAPPAPGAAAPGAPAAPKAGPVTAAPLPAPAAPTPANPTAPTVPTAPRSAAPAVPPSPPAPTAPKAAPAPAAPTPAAAPAPAPAPSTGRGKKPRGGKKDG